MAPIMVPVVQLDQMVVFGIVAVASICSLFFTVVVCGCCSSAKKETPPEMPSAPQQQQPPPTKEPLDPPPLSPSVLSDHSSLNPNKDAVGPPVPAVQPVSAAPTAPVSDQMPNIENAASFQLTEYQDRSMGKLPGKAMAADLNAMPSLQLMGSQRPVTPGSNRDGQSTSSSAKERKIESQSVSAVVSPTVPTGSASGPGPSISMVASSNVSGKNAGSSTTSRPKKDSKPSREKKKKKDSTSKSSPKKGSAPVHRKRMPRKGKGAPMELSASGSLGNTSSEE